MIGLWPGVALELQNIQDTLSKLAELRHFDSQKMLSKRVKSNIKLNIPRTDPNTLAADKMLI